ncbi:MAG: DUF3990 domain-containing protein [Bacteroidales bacterium]|nr:DUF3990 domain-containing protein [Bacteroidales bacterium]
MILYHGSNIDFSVIDLQKSKPNKDFGRAFYLSDNEAQALEMAEFKVSTFGGTCVVNRFECDDAILADKTLKIKQFSGYSDEWAEFVFLNRDTEQTENIHNYDIVYGPIANDRVGRQIMNLKEGYISFQEFMNRLHFMKGITFQYAFCTSKAIEKLKKI